MKPADSLVRSLGLPMIGAGDPGGLLESIEQLTATLSHYETIRMMGDPRLSGDDLREALIEAFPRLHPAALELVVTLAAERRIDLFAPVADWVGGVLRRGRLARVWSAGELTPNQIIRLSEALARLAGVPVEMSVEVDPGLIAGIVVQLGTRRWDFSASGALRHLWKAVNRSVTDAG